MPATRIKEGRMNEETPPQGGNEILVVPPESTNREIRDVLVALVQAVTTQMNLNMVPRLIL